MSQVHADIIDVAEQCSKTAAGLLAELEKLQLDSGEGLGQAIKKSIRALRRKNFVKEIQSNLEKYQQILDTRILVGLNAHSLQQAKDFRALDQGVQDLIVAVSQGRTTVAQLLVNQGQVLRDHIDRRFHQHSQAKTDLEAQQRFKESLFYPEIFSREEEIPRAHQGTCRWIFRSSARERSDQNGTYLCINAKKDTIAADRNKELVEDDSNTILAQNAQDSDESLSEDDQSSDDFLQHRSWPSFTDWLEYSDSIYWLNGKPGSGKSTLMKYIIGELQENARANKAATNWARGSEIVPIHFYFWNSGMALQHSLRGFLRSLLFQIANHGQDMITMMMEQASPKYTPYKPFVTNQIYSWTEERLLFVLQRVLTHKPWSISFCFFIDGLDEFIGDEDILIRIIRLLNDTPQTKVCVSSRPEQIFRQGFSTSPQLKLQDFNYKDMKKMATDILPPVLIQRFPNEQKEIDNLMNEVISKAQGVFLWLQIMTKDLTRGARNGDTIAELLTRLEVTPDTLEGLYEHMLNRLDKSYLQDAIKYFRVLIASVSSNKGRPLNLLDSVCAETVPWKHIQSNNKAYFKSAEFLATCHNTETRIATRCAGLVENVEHHSDKLWGMSWVSNDGATQKLVATSEEAKEISSHLRDVRFIHRTVVDFLKSHHQSFFQDPNWRAAATLTIARGKVGFMTLLPIIVSKRGADECFISMGFQIEDTMRTLISLGEPEGVTKNIARGFEDVILEMVDFTYEVINFVEECFNGPDYRWCIQYPWDEFLRNWRQKAPYHDCHGFAAFFGCSKYVMRHISLPDFAQKRLNYLFMCTLMGLALEGGNTTTMIGYLTILEELLRQGADPNLLLNLHRRDYEHHVSAFGMFIKETFGIIIKEKLEIIITALAQHPQSWFIAPDLNPEHQPLMILLYKKVVELFISHGTDIDTGILSKHREVSHDFNFPEMKKFESLYYIGFTVEESPLSHLEGQGVVNAKFHTLEELNELTNFTVALVNLLQSHGARRRRRFHNIRIAGYIINQNGPLYREPRRYRLSQDHSDRLYKVWPYRQLAQSKEDGKLCRDKFRSVIEEIMASITDADLETNSNTTLKGLFLHEEAGLVREIN